MSIDSSPDVYSALLSMMLALVLILVMMIVALGYIFLGIGLSTMAKNRGLSQKAFWAWIPIGQDYLFGLLARDTSLIFGTKTYRNMQIILPVCCAIHFLIAMLSVAIEFIAIDPFFGLLIELFSSIAALAVSIIFLVCFYGLIKGYDRKNSAGMHTAIAVFVPLYICIIVFAFRNRGFIGLLPTGNEEIVPVTQNLAADGGSDI